MNTNYNAKIIAHSISPDGITLITMEIEYPRFIHSELMTHRILSKNAASSRAIPIEAMHAHIISNTAQPIYWGANQAGMQAAKEIEDIPAAIAVWMKARDAAIASAKELSGLNCHKQTANRLTEPFMVMKTIISGTEWGNLFHLRDHEAAQPEFRYLVKLMRTAITNSRPVLLQKGEWHLPYVNSVRNEFGHMEYLGNNREKLQIADARKISAACCAQVSYRKLNDTTDKCYGIYKKLIESDPKHCFVDGIEVLTKSGFKLFKEVLPNDLIANIDQQSLQFINWENPLNIVKRELQSDEVIYYYPSIELGVTNNHKMLGSIVSNSKSRQVYTHSIFRPGDLTNAKCKKGTQGEREALLPKSCNVPNNINFESYTLGQLIGFYIGDGFYKENKTLYFRLVKDRKIDYLSKLLTSLGISFNLKNRKNDLTSSGNQVCEIDFVCDFNFGLECGKGSLNKEIPKIAYTDMSLLSGVFDGLKNSDGSIKRNTWTYSTTSPNLKEQIVALAPLVGLSIIENKMQDGCYKLMTATRKYIRINDARHQDYNKLRIYNNKQHVYCVEVSGGALVIRTPSGQTMLSGNCSPVEHQATPIDLLSNVYQDGITHMTKDGMLWSGNFRGWIQFRKQIPNECVW